MGTMQSLDPHQRPPNSIRDVYKKYQRMKPMDLEQDRKIVDLGRALDLNLQSTHMEDHPTQSPVGKVAIVGKLERKQLTATFRAFTGSYVDKESLQSPVPVYAHEDIPGLHIIPSLLPLEIQTVLLSKLLHRDLSSPSHLTNIHTHYDLNYPPTGSSFFSIPPSSPSPLACPLDPSIHRPLGISQLLNRKIRWTTLGGQYDWTEKRYPESPPPAFPPDIRDLLEGLFPGTKAQAAIVNLYSPGDTLSVHRDVAEQCGKGLISVSLGCDAIFVIGTSSTSPLEPDDIGREDEHQKTKDEVNEKILTLRLRSGDAVYMSGDGRFAWHGVPQVLKNTCPAYLKEWPGGPHGEYEDWRGWMSGKRVNLNVRQMWD